jgi:twitching motility two-component system response regulator PilH
VSLIESEQRSLPDRRRVSRGGRRALDRAGAYPPVLVADSYDGVRTSCSRYLDRFNFQVLQAADGEQALARINAEAPQVILTELNLPEMPAWRLAQWLSQNWRTRQIPVIVLAAGLEPGTNQDFQSLVAGVLLKPFQLQTMLGEIRRVLRTPDQA